MPDHQGCKKDVYDHDSNSENVFERSLTQKYVGGIDAAQPPSPSLSGGALK
jgi:hypothetical protein